MNYQFLGHCFSLFSSLLSYPSLLPIQMPQCCCDIIPAWETGPAPTPFCHFTTVSHCLQRTCTGNPYLRGCGCSLGIAFYTLTGWYSLDIGTVNSLYSLLLIPLPALVLSSVLGWFSFLMMKTFAGQDGGQDGQDRQHGMAGLGHLRAWQWLGMDACL